MSKRKQYLAAIAAHVIKGLPAPISVDLEYGGDPEYLGIKLDTIAEALEWLALEPGAFTYDHRYEPNDNHPHGYRILGGSINMLGVKMHVTAVDDLPGPVDTEDAEAVLAFVATVTTVPADSTPPPSVAAATPPAPATTPDIPRGGEEAAAALADGAAASTPERATCKHCGEPIWKGLVWVHDEQEDARCWTGGTYAEPAPIVPPVTDPAALDDLGVAVTGADEVAPIRICSIWPHAGHGNCPGVYDGVLRDAFGRKLSVKPDADGDLIAPYTADEVS